MATIVRRATLGVFYAVLSLTASPAQALLIGADYEGEFLNQQIYRDVGNAAKGTWESLAEGWYRVESYDFTVTIGTADLGPDAYALTYSNLQTASPYPSTGTYLWTEARIVLNSNSTWWSRFWWDPTPLENTEYDMNQYDGLYGSAKTGTAADNMLDAYSIILHELGHALGFMGASGTASLGGSTFSWNAYSSFEDNLSDAYKTFTFDYLADKKGTKIPMGGNRAGQDCTGEIVGNPYHLNGGTYPYDSMSVFEKCASGPQPDFRILISSLDLNMISDAFHLVPVPPTLALLAIGLGGLGAAIRRRARRN